MSIDTDQATVDAWLAAGVWVEFAPGRCTCPLGFPTENGLHIERCATQPHRESLPPADWAADQKCETCWLPPGGKPNSTAQEYLTARCPDCNGTGLRRHPVQVPAISGPGTYGPTTSGTLTVAWATVEWGPLLVVGDDGYCNDHVPHLVVCDGPSVGQDTPAAWICGGDNLDECLPPDIDPATPIGLYARGGSIEAATP